MYQIHVDISQIKVIDKGDSVVIAIPTQVFSDTNPPLQQHQKTDNQNQQGQPIRKIPYNLILKQNGANQVSVFQRLQEQYDSLVKPKQYHNIKEQEDRARPNVLIINSEKIQTQISNENEFSKKEQKNLDNNKGNQSSNHPFNRSSSPDQQPNNNSFSYFSKNTFSNTPNNPMSNNYIPNSNGSQAQMNIFSNKSQQNNLNRQSNTHFRAPQNSQQNQQQIFKNNLSLNSSINNNTGNTSNIFLPSNAGDSSLFSGSNSMNRSSSNRSTSRGKRPSLS